MIQKLLIIALGIFLVLAAGTCSLYPLYLSTLKEKFNYSLTKLNLYGSFINIGLWEAFTVGIIYDKFGPKISCIVSLILLPGSYSILDIIFRSSRTSLNIIWLLLIGFLMGQGSSLAYTTALTTNLKNFSSLHSSAIVGLIVSNMAISPSIFTSYREALPKVENKNFFIAVAIFIAIVIAICAALFQNMSNLYSEHRKLKNYENYKEERILSMFIALNIITLFVYVIGVIYNNIKGKAVFPNIIIYPLLQSLNFVFVLLEKFEIWDKILFRRFVTKDIRDKEKIHEKMEKENLSLYLEKYGKNVVLQPQKEEQPKNEQKCDKAKKEEKKESENFQQNNTNKIIENNNNESSVDSTKNENANDETDIEKEKKNINQNDKKNNPDIENKIIEKKKYQDETVIANQDNKQEQSKRNSILNLLKICISKEIILLFTLLTFSMGSVISNLNNVQFITKSIILNSSTRDSFEYAILYFTFNSFTRIITGLLLSSLIKRNKLFQFIILISVFGFLSQFLGIFMNRHVLYLSIALAGATHGCYMTFIPIYCRVTYKISDMGKILGFLTTGNAFGSLIVGCFIFTAFFEHYKNEQGECFGARCFRGGYILNSIFMLFGVGITIYLYKLNKKKKSTSNNINDSKVSME